MGCVTVSCLLLLLACLLAPTECYSITTASTKAPCRKDQRCYRTALCETCSQTEVQCYEDTDLSLLNALNFKDDFCGHHGVVLVDKKSGRLRNLLPLECSNGICPEKSECKQNPKDGVSYCCSLEKLDGSESARRNCGAAIDSMLDDPTDVQVADSGDDTDAIPGTRVSHTQSSTDSWTDNTNTDIGVEIEAVREISEKQTFRSTDIWADIVDTYISDEKDDIHDIGDAHTVSSTALWADMTNTDSGDEIVHNDLEGGVNAKFSSPASRIDIMNTDSGHDVVHENLEIVVSDALSLPASRRGIIRADSGDETAHTDLKGGDSDAFSNENSTTLELSIDTIQYTTVLDEVAMVKSRCFTLDLVASGKEAVKQKITDENGHAVNISKVTIVLENSDVKCLQGWSYSYMHDTVYMSNQCPVRFEICYEPATSTTISPSITDYKISCKEVTLECAEKQHKKRTIFDRNKNPVHILNITVVEQLTDVACEEGKNFFIEGSKVSIKDGCGAIFQICYPEPVTADITSSRQRPEANKIIISRPGACETVNLSSTAVSAAEAKGEGTAGNPLYIRNAYIQEEYSTVKCQPVLTYLFTRDLIRATDGCRASFKVCFEDLPQITSPKPKPTATHMTCETVVLSSTRDTPTVKKFYNTQGRPVALTSMKVVNWFAWACRLGKTYSFALNAVQVSGGCRGNFRVCYLNDTKAQVITTPKVQTNSPVVTTPKVQTNSSVVTTPKVQTNSSVVTTPNVQTEPQVVTTLNVQTEPQDVTTPKVQTNSPVVTTPKVETNLPVVTTLKVQINATHTTCEIVVLSSTHDTPIVKNFYDAQGRPVVLISMGVVNRFAPACRLGETYAFAGNTVQVTGGCRGDFEVCYLNNTEPQIVTTLGVQTEPQVVTTPNVQTEPPVVTTLKVQINATHTTCETVDLSSTADTVTIKKLYDAQNRPVDVISMEVVNRYAPECRLGETYQFALNIVVVTGRCREHFRVCYLNNTEPQLVTTLGVQTEPQDVTTPKVQTEPQDVTTPKVQTEPQDVTTPKVQTEPQDVTTLRVQTNSPVVTTPKVQTNSPVVTTPKVQTNSPVVTSPKVPINEPVCREVTLRGPEHDRVINTLISTNNNNPLLVVSMELVEQISTVQCLQWFNFYFEGSTVLAKNGCWGRFEVCYLENVTVTPILLNEPEGQSCRFITLSSIRSREVQRDIADVQGQKVALTSMTLARQFSQTPCVSGTTFSFDGPKAVVRGGCIGTFQICTDAKVIDIIAPAGELCDKELVMFSYIVEPEEYNVTDSKRTPLAIRGMILVKQISEINCVAGHSYFFIGSVLHARDGCKGIFKICYNVSGGQTGKPTSAVTTPVPTRGDHKCERVKLTSRLNLPVKKTFFDAEGRPIPIASVKLVEQISQTKCVEGDTFKLFQYKLRVSGGCKGVFDVCLETADEEFTTPAPTTGDDQKCERVKLMSRLTVPVKKTFIDAEGYPIPITSVTVVKPISQIECVEGDTFAVYPYALRVFGGCKAVFEVCLDKVDEELTTPASITDEECMKVQIDSTRPNTFKGVKILDRSKRPVRIVSVEVDEQLTDVPCEAGETFRYEGNIVRATGGCGAVFNICYEKQSLSSPKEECVNVPLRSSPGKTNAADIRDKRKNPVRIVSVKVLTQYSYTPCIHSETYRFDGGIFKASDGCSALFNVCYEKKS